MRATGTTRTPSRSMGSPNTRRTVSASRACCRTSLGSIAQVFVRGLGRPRSALLGLRFGARSVLVTDRRGCLGVEVPAPAPGQAVELAARGASHPSVGALELLHVVPCPLARKAATATHRLTNMSLDATCHATARRRAVMAGQCWN